MRLFGSFTIPYLLEGNSKSNESIIFPSKFLVNPVPVKFELPTMIKALYELCAI